MFRTIAYLRVSTLDQDLEKNKADIVHLANEKDLGKENSLRRRFPGTFLGNSVRSAHFWRQ